MNQVGNPYVRSVSFSILEAHAITRTPRRRIHDLIDAKVFKPAILSGQGNGKDHRVSGQQCYAIACVGASSTLSEGLRQRIRQGGVRYLRGCR